MVPGTHLLSEASLPQETPDSTHAHVEPHVVASPGVVTSVLPQLLRGIELLEGELRRSRARERRGVALVAKLRDYIEVREQQAEDASS